MPDSSSRSVWDVPEMGSLSKLRLRHNDASLPSHPPQGHLRVNVRAIGLNYADVCAILGLYSAAPKTPFVPGLEFSGEVEDASGAPSFKKGDRVYCVTRFGAYASKIDIDARYCRKMPRDWTFEEGASFPVQALTAYYGLKPLGALQANHSVLVHAAAGGVGLQALAILEKFPGCTVIGLVGSTEKIEYLRKRYRNQKKWDFVLRDPVSTLEQRLRGKLLELAPEGRAGSAATAGDDNSGSGAASVGFNLILDSLGGQYFTVGYDLLKPTGRVVVFGAASIVPPASRTLSILNPAGLLHPSSILATLAMAYRFLRRPKVDTMEMMHHNKSVMGFNLIWLYENVDLMEQLFQELEQLNLGKPIVGNTFLFDELIDACAFLGSGNSVGKVVVRIPEQ